MKSANLSIHDIASVRYGRVDLPGDTAGHAFSVHYLYVLNANGTEAFRLALYGDISFIDFPNASPTTEAASTAPDVAGSGMAPAPESIPTPVAGGPSTCDKFVGVDRVFCAVCERQEHEHPSSPNYDGAPYCSYGHRTKADCDCGPIAENE